MTTTFRISYVPTDPYGEWEEAMQEDYTDEGEAYTRFIALQVQAQSRYNIVNVTMEKVEALTLTSYDFFASDEDYANGCYLYRMNMKDAAQATAFCIARGMKFQESRITDRC